jgi:hypothetical protein
MLIYLDSADLINICRGKSQIGIAELRQRLAAGSHQIVLSLDTLIEIAAALRNGLQLEVRSDLNSLDDLPHIFINEARIRDMEMREALAAFEQGREYEVAAVGPFSSRLDRAIDVQGRRQYVNQPVGAQLVRVNTDMIVNFQIWDAIIYMFQQDPETFDVQRRLEQEWSAVMEADRMLKNPPSLSDHFVTTMSRNLNTHGIQAPEAGVEPFARWVYNSPSRCPGIRLAYETQHCFRKNLKARPRASDLIDLARIAAVPYVDLFVADGEMLNYCRQAVRSIGLPYQERLGDFAMVISRLKNSANS